MGGPVRSIVKPTVVLMSGRALGAAVSFCIPVVLARVFDQATFGTYKQLFLIYATLYGIAQLGMAESLFYFVPSDPGKAGRYSLNAMLVLACAGAACLGLLWAGAEEIGRAFSNPGLSAGAPLIGLFLALMLASAGLEIVLTARQRFAWAACAYAASDLLRTVLLLVPVLLFRSLEWLLYGAIVSAALRLVAAALYVRREFNADLGPDRALLTRQMAYALPFEMAVLVEILQTNLHQYAVSWHFDVAAFAVYSVGCLQVPLVDLVAGSSSNVMMVRMAEDLHDGRGGSVLATWHEATRKLALVFFPLVGLLLVTARELIVVLFTAGYLASVPIFMVWSVSFLLCAFQVDGVLRVYADTRALLGLGTIKLVLIATTVSWFLTRFGLIGAVLVTVLASAVAKALALARLRRHLRVPVSELLPWTGLAATLGSAAAAGLLAWIIKAELDLAPLPLLLTTSLSYALVYLGLCGAFGGTGLRTRLAALRAAQR